MSAVEFLAGSKVRGPARIYYWGVNDRDLGWTPLFADFLDEQFRESRNRLSEPDIIIEADSVVVFVEAKFTSGNEPQESSKLSKYLSDDWVLDESGLEAAGLYELVRNWAIGLAWARMGPGKRRFVLVNLVRQSAEVDIEKRFGSLIRQNEWQRFRRVTWESLVCSVCRELAERFGAVTSYCRPAFPSLASPQ